MGFLDYISPRLKERLRRSNEDRRDSVRLASQERRQAAEERRYVPLASPPPRRPSPSVFPAPEPPRSQFEPGPMPLPDRATIERSQGGPGLGFLLKPLAPRSITDPIARGIGTGARSLIEHGPPGVGYIPLAASEATGINPEFNVGGQRFQPLRHGLVPLSAGEEAQRAVEEEAQRILPSLTSPVGLAATAAFPGATAYGTAAAAAGGIGGRLAERAGFDPRLRLDLPVVGETNIGPRAAGEIIGGAYGGPGRKLSLPEFDTEAAGVAARNTLSEVGQAVPEPVSAGRAVDSVPPEAQTAGRELGDVRLRDAGAAPEPLPGAGGGRIAEPAADTGLPRGGPESSAVGAVEGPVPPARGLASVADDAERAALNGEPPPPRAPTEPAPIGRRPPYPLPSTLHTVGEVADDVRRSTQNFAGAVARTTGKLPPVRTALDLVNPTALVDVPPTGLAKELGLERAQDLQAQLIAHARKTDQGSAIASAIEESIDQEARRVGFTVNDGVISVGGRELGPVGDVFENPSRYALDGPQRQLADDVHAVLQDMNLAEKAAGVAKGEIFSGEGRYFPRRVTAVRGVENMRAQVRRMTGVKQGFQKGRFYEEMAAGMENGVDYGGSVGSLVGTRIRAGVRAVSDNELAQLVRPLGRTMKGGRGANVGEMGTMVPAFGGRVFPRETSIRIMEGLNPRPPASVIGAADQVNNLIRPLVANGDLSATTLQLLPTLTRNPVAWGKAVAYSLDSIILDGRMYGRYAQANARWIERYIGAGGLWNGSEFTFDAAARGRVLSTLLKRGPLGRTNNAFNTSVNVAALENFKGMVGVGDSMGSDFMRRAGQVAFGNVAGETSDEIAASIASKMTGRMSTKALGVQAQQRAVESALTFAPKYYRAAFGLLGDAIQGGMRGAEARRVLGSLAAGSLLSYVGIAKALGQDPQLDPSKGTFMTVTVGGKHVGIGGPFYGIARLVASGAAAPEKLGKLDMSNPAYRWGRGRASPVMALVTDLVKESTYMGKELDSPRAILEHVATSVLPFSAQSAIEEGPGTIPTQILGMREFPTSPSERKNERAAQVVGASEIPEIAAQAGRDYWTMDIDAQAALDADPEASALQAKIDQGQRERQDAGQLAQDKVNAKQDEITAAQEADNKRFTGGDMEYDDWKAATIRRRAELRGFKDATYGDMDERDTSAQPIREAVDRYFQLGADAIVANTDELTGRINWDAVKKEQAKAFEGLTAHQRNSAQDYIERNLTQTERDEKAAQRLYYDEAPAKYRGMDAEESQAIDDFIRQVDEAQQQLQDELGYPVLKRNVAEVLADDMGKPRMADDWKRLSGKKTDDVISERYDRWLKRHRDELEPFFGWLYNRSFEERIGEYSPESPFGMPRKPPLPPKPSKPPTLAEMQRDREEQRAIERELAGVR